MDAVTAAARPAPRRPALREPAQRYLVGGAAVAGLLLAWQLVAASGVINPHFMATPGGVVDAGAAMARSGELWSNARVSLVEFGIGFVLSVAVGLPVGVLMGWHQLLRELFEPFMMALYAMPRIALLPVIVVWLGVGGGSKIAVVFIGAVIPIIVNAMAGVRDANPKLVQAARSFCANDRQLFSKLLLPGALPSILAGVRLGVGRAVDGVVIAELYASVAGIGSLLQKYGSTYRTAQLFFLVLVVAMFGYAATTLVQRAEARLLRWRPE